MCSHNTGITGVCNHGDLHGCVSGCDNERNFSDDEQGVLDIVTDRLNMGRDVYGALRINSDPRLFAREYFLEQVDAALYAAMGAIRAERLEAEAILRNAEAAGCPRRVYVCHKYSDDPAGNEAACRHIASYMAERGDLPIAPQLYLPQIYNENDPQDRELALSACLSFLSTCALVVRCQVQASPGMALEIDFARCMGIPIVSLGEYAQGDKGVPALVRAAIESGSSHGDH